MRKIPPFTPVRALFVFLIVLSIAAFFCARSLEASEPGILETMAGGPPIPLIADPRDSFFRVVPSPERLYLLALLSTFNINYISGGTNAFGDTCIPWPAEAQIAFDYAATVWGTYLESSVPITINACWATNLGSGILGHSGSRNFFRDFSGAPVANTWYPVSLANALHGSDLDPGAADMEIAYSSTFNWYFGTDGLPGSGQYDFISVVMHEIAHGLGFAGSMSVSGGLGRWGGGTSYPIAYDRFTENGLGQDLIDTSVFPNGSVALAAQLTSNNLYFNGTNANAAYGGNRPELYAPSTWAQGSSYSHLGEVFNGTVNALMTFSIGSAEVIHDPGPVTLGIFKDIGWTSSTSTCTYSIDPSSNTVGPGGGSGSVEVTTQNGCGWTATESLGWVAITSGSGGTGSGTVNYTVSANSGAQRSGTITISGQAFTGTHTVVQEGVATDLLQNPGFESGNTLWVQESGFWDIIWQPSGTDLPARSGSWYAWFGGYANANDVLYQQVTIPSWACGAYVQFWYYIDTEETSGQNDIMSVEIRSSGNALLKTLKTVSNLDQTSGWVQSEQLDVTEFIGQTVRLRFAATLNGTYNTSFFIDDVSLMVISAGDIYVKGDWTCAGKNPCFSSIQGGVNGVSTCTTINITGETYNENIVLNGPMELIFQGGWNADFTSCPSSTTINGSLTINNGGLIVENIILQ